MGASDEPDQEESEETLPGSVGAVRVGSTVRKVAGPWTPTIHALLSFLRESGFDPAPAPLGLDDRGREVLSWVPGAAATRPWPEVLLRDEGVIALGSTLRRFHDVVRAFDPGEDACWRIGCRALQPGEVVCHGDFAPWNTVWTSGRLVGVIDWDMAEPGVPLFDLAFLAPLLVPLRPDAWARGVGFVGAPARARRLSSLCTSYGDVEPGEVVETVSTLYERDRDRTLRLGAQGKQPWATFLSQGAVDLIDDDTEWLCERRSTLVTQ
jgi:hypothetical protein